MKNEESAALSALKLELEKSKARCERAEDDLSWRSKLHNEAQQKIAKLDAELDAAKKEREGLSGYTIENVNELHRRLEEAERRAHSVRTSTTCRDRGCTGDSNVCGVCAELERLESELVAAKKECDESRNHCRIEMQASQNALAELSETQAKLETVRENLTKEKDRSESIVGKYLAQEKVIERAKPFMGHKTTCTVGVWNLKCNCGYEAFLGEIGETEKGRPCCQCNGAGFFFGIDPKVNTFPAPAIKIKCSHCGGSGRLPNALYCGHIPTCLPKSV